MKNIYRDDKKLRLEVRDENDKFVRSYHIWYNSSEGSKFKLIINNNEYAITGDGEIIDKALT